MKRKILAWFGIMYLSVFVGIVFAASENGFVSSSPDQYGSSTDTWPKNVIMAQKFVVPGSGTKTLSEIGAYARNNTSGSVAHLQLMIFTHDATNDRPETELSNSRSSSITVGNTMSKLSYTYSTKPTVTGGGTYWIVFQGQDYTILYSANTSGGSGAYFNWIEYPEVPTGNDWHKASAMDYDYDVYAVYEDGSTTTSTSTSTTSTEAPTTTVATTSTSTSTTSTEAPTTTVATTSTSTSTTSTEAPTTTVATTSTSTSTTSTEAPTTTVATTSTTSTAAPTTTNTTSTTITTTTQAPTTTNTTSTTVTTTSTITSTTSTAGTTTTTTLYRRKRLLTLGAG